MMPLPERKHGFSLIEINLAIFVVAIGMLTLFSLFPTGMKQVETAHEDTQAALFADYVLNTIRANTIAITNPADWADPGQVRQVAVADVGTEDVAHDDAVGGPVEFPVGSGLQMRYLLNINSAGSGVYAATLWCKSGEYGATKRDTFEETASKFYTKLFYSGMP